IGGGVIGCSIAWQLARAGVSVLVLERSIPGAEASSAAGGILAAQEESTAPGPLTDLFLASRARFAAISAALRDETGLDIGYRAAGVTAAAFGAADEDRLEKRFAWQRDAGLRLRWLRGSEIHDVEPALGPSVTAALHFPDDGQVEPRAYLKALSLAAAAAGA